ncbi:MAG: GrpB family protein, partial [Verrucomicrobia bacterium]|nr:GrpB family protein [Verrucomicrobiota bacterium]
MKIEVTPYRSRWASDFEIEKNAIRGAVGNVAVGVHHIGSTAVVGLAAKPIIDIMLEVGDLTELDACAGNIESLGYEALGELGISGRRYFRKGRDHRTHQIHAFQTSDPNLLRHLAFRDYLRN